MLLKMNNLLLEEAGNAGSTGAGSVLTSSSGGGAGQVPQGDKNTGNATGANAQTTGNNSASSAAAGTANSDWKSSLPKELQEEPSLKLFNDVGALAKSYISAQKLVGAEKIALPSKHATDEDWKGIYEKLGLPKEIKDYDVKFKEGASLQEDFVSAFKETSHKAGILPKQAQAIADWFSEANAKAEERISNEYKSAQTKNIEGLKTEWGAAFELKISKARQVLSEAGSKELSEYLETSGLGNDTNLIRLLASIGDKFYSEGKEKGSRGSMDSAYAPKEAQREMTKIQGDATHPYWVKEHPGHKAAVEEMQNLMKMAYPSQTAIDNNP